MFAYLNHARTLTVAGPRRISTDFPFNLVDGEDLYVWLCNFVHSLVYYNIWWCREALFPVATEHTLEKNKWCPVWTPFVLNKEGILSSPRPAATNA